MALTPNTFTAENTPHFIGFTPYALPANIISVDNVSDMISYSFVTPSPEVKLSYLVGATDTYVVNMSISNVTENVVLDIEVVVDNTIFTVVRASKFSLNPKEGKVITITLNKDGLNMQDPFEKKTSIKLVVTNKDTGIQAIKNVNTAPVPPQVFPSTIDIT